MLSSAIYPVARVAISLAFVGFTAALFASDAETIGLVAMRRERPSITGVGIAVAQPEGSEGPNAWQVNPALSSPGVYFTWTSSLGTATNFPNVVGVESGHANGVATQFYYNNPLGVALGVPRVDSYEALHFINSLIVPQIPIAARVVNQSFIITNAVNPFYDAYAARYNVVVVAAMNNIPDSPPGAGSAHNVIGVGIYSASAQSSVGPTSDGRAKPDLVGVHPCCTSFSTPQVSGSAALLLQAGADNQGGPDTANLATNSATIKALLLNGAVKTTNWTNGFRRPLDARYGAGVLNMYNSDLQLRGGRYAAIATNSVVENAPHPPTSDTNNVPSLRGWDFSSMQSTLLNDRVAHYYFNLPTNTAAYSATATLAWLKGTALTNLELFLYETAGNTLVTCSTSSVDNVEHIFVPKLPAGRYDLQVLKHGGVTQRGSEDYALAFDFSPVRVAVERSGGDVVVSWPASPAGFTLQTASALNPPISWQNIAASDSILSNAMNTVVLPAFSGSMFFRLFRP